MSPRYSASVTLRSLLQTGTSIAAITASPAATAVGTAHAVSGPSRLANLASIRSPNQSGNSANPEKRYRAAITARELGQIGRMLIHGNIVSANQRARILAPGRRQTRAIIAAQAPAAR